MRERLDRTSMWMLLGLLGLLVATTVQQQGSDPWFFNPSPVKARGVLGPLVRLAHGRWDRDVVRAPVLLAGLLVAVAALATWRVRSWRGSHAVALAATVGALLLVPSVALQVALRDGAGPWYFTNDSTYQIELAGDLVLDGHNPYGHDYRGSGLERWYPATHQTKIPQVALHHFAYFPGTVETAAAWRLLPAPFDDYRIFVLLATAAAFGAALLFRAPLLWRLAAGVFLAANPVAVRAAWFGTADAPSLLGVVLAFALVTRRRFGLAAASLAAAVLLKQFALVAVPFVAAMLVVLRAPRSELKRAALVFVGIVVAGALPFVVWAPGALWRDTIAYGAGTYRIIGYGVAGLLVKAGVIRNRFDPYPFVLVALFVWLPTTIWLVREQLRSRRLWTGAAGFAVSMFILLFVSRVFQNSYIVWPLAGIATAALLAVSESESSPGA